MKTDNNRACFHKPKPSDMIICITVLFIALTLFVVSRSGETGTAEIIVDGETVYSVDLSTAKNETLSFGDTIIEIRDGEIGFMSSDCAGHDCVRTGFISRAGQCAVCIPNKTVIKIKGRGKNIPDAVSY